VMWLQGLRFIIGRCFLRDKSQNVGVDHLELLGHVSYADNRTRTETPEVVPFKEHCCFSIVTCLKSAKAVPMVALVFYSQSFHNSKNLRM